MANEFAHALDMKTLQLASFVIVIFLARGSLEMWSLMVKISKDLRQGHANVFQYITGGRKLKYFARITDAMPGALLWAGLAVGLMGLVFGFELLGEVAQSFLETLCELVQESLESLYRNKFKLDQYHAQMATAYTCFFMIMAVGYLVVKKCLEMFKNVRNAWNVEREKATGICFKHWHNCLGIWESMDGFNKCFALVGLVVVAVPVVSLVCVALGKIVAELI